MNKLQVGDVFKLTKDMEAYVTLPQKFIYSNVLDGDREGDEPGTTKITVGEVRTSKPNKLFVQKAKKLNTSMFEGDYVVVKTSLSGGGTGHGPHDVYPDGWKVNAKKLNNSAYDPDEVEISFYQSGAFTAMNENVPVIRAMSMTFV